MLNLVVVFVTEKVEIQTRKSNASTTNTSNDPASVLIVSLLFSASRLILGKAK